MPIDTFQQMMLDEHNKYRRQMCANALQEDDELHTEAMRRAHSVANGRPLPLPDEYNENDVVFDTGDPSKITSERQTMNGSCSTGDLRSGCIGAMIVREWFDESKQYNGTNEESALKFSQLVWKSSSKLGVGHAYDGHKLYVVALYKPSGNIRGEFGANVGCAAKAAPSQAAR